MQTLSRSPASRPAAPGTARLAQDTASYLRDNFQRSVLTLDVLRERGDIFIADFLAGKPPLLKFEHELLIDGSTLAHPCNHSLLRIVPPVGARIDEARRCRTGRAAPSKTRCPTGCTRCATSIWRCRC